MGLFLDGLVLEYRDPLFGIIVLVTLIFVISFLTYSFSMYKEKEARREYRKLFKRFELGKLKEDDYVHLYKTYNLPFDSVILLASTFIHKGDFTKAISVYLTLLEHVNDRVKKEELLELLGSTYFKAGLLQRAKDIFLKILNFSPRNKQALTYLLICYEKLKEFDNAYEVTESLEELKVNISQEKTYLHAMQVINDPINSYKKKCTQLIEIYDKDKLIQRVLLQYLLQFNKTYLWENITLFDTKNAMDLFWYLSFEDINFDAVAKDNFLTQLYCAKGYIKQRVKSDIFELGILIMLQKDKDNQQADLNFEFICKKCKHIYPIFENRCPHCHSILSFQIELEITRSYFEKNQSLQ